MKKHNKAVSEFVILFILLLIASIIKFITKNDIIGLILIDLVVIVGLCVGVYLIKDVIDKIRSDGRYR